jgi:hypothetical protein
VVLADPQGEGKARYRAPIDLYCVLDVSGSMDEEVSVQTAGGKNETHGLTKLDLVKHAMRTIVNGMCDNDRLTVVQFNSVAQTVAEPLQMTKQGKARILSELERLSADGGTNLWAGLLAGLELARAAAAPAPGEGTTLVATAAPDATRVKAVFLLTDGIPTIVPPRGHLPMLQRYLRHRSRQRRALQKPNFYLVCVFVCVFCRCCAEISSGARFADYLHVWFWLRIGQRAFIGHCDPRHPSRLHCLERTACLISFL